MNNYWITFSDGACGFCNGTCEFDAKLIAFNATGKQAVSAASIPYPASPVIWQFDHPVYGKTPTFCNSPHKCAGHTSCPQSRSCTE